MTKGIDVHIEDLKSTFVWAPDTRIETHPIKVAQGEWTAVIGVIEGTFTRPMPIGDGKFIEPTGKPFKLTMSTFGHWTKEGTMDEEYLFWDNQEFMCQIGLANNPAGHDNDVSFPPVSAAAELAAVCAKLGRIPTVEEYMSIVPEKLAGKTDDVYKYLNFNEIANYHLEARDEAEEKYGVTIKPI